MKIRTIGWEIIEESGKCVVFLVFVREFYSTHSNFQERTAMDVN